MVALTSQKGVDHIREVGGGRGLVQSITAINPGGQITVIGFLAAFTSDLPLFSLVVKQAVLRRISVGPRRALEDMNQAFARLQLHPVIDPVYAFEDALSAYGHLYRGVFGKIVTRVRE